MKIHFVCSSNTYRSRLANTYLNSKEIPGIEASSSGILANENLLGPITWYAQRLIQNERLVRFMPLLWTHTTSQLLKNADRVIFMDESHLEYCKKHFNFFSKNYEVWNIKDMSLDLRTEAEKIVSSERTFKEIKSKVDNLVMRLHLKTKL